MDVNRNETWSEAEREPLRTGKRYLPALVLELSLNELKRKKIRSIQA